MWLKVKNFWNMLPKPVKVAVYILGSQLLAQLAKDVTRVPEVVAVYVGIIINFLLVLVEYGKSKVDTYRKAHKTPTA